HWRRKIINYRIQQRLHALVLERRSGDHRHQFQRNRRPAQRRAKFRWLQFVLIEVLRQDRVIVLRDVLHNLFAMFFVKFRTQTGGHDGLVEIGAGLAVFGIPESLERQDFVLGSERLVLPYNRALFDKIDYADEVIFASDGVGNSYGVGRKS